MRRAGLAAEGELLGQLEAYYRLLEAWNRKINLTGFALADAPADALDRLLVEPLVAAKLVPLGTRRMLDIGSGGGSPAIPMALARPELELRMVESKVRKSVFLLEAVRATGLGSARVETARFEELLSTPELHERHDLLTTRAVRLEPRKLQNLQAFLKPGGLAMLFRGGGTSDNLDFVHPPFAWKSTHPLLDAPQSRVVLLEKLPVGRSVPRGTG
jgi:16S rRNA (guanine527-N7)-methyltransferase